MAEQIGQIIAIKSANDCATVSVTKAAACSHGSCGLGIFPDQDNELLIDAQNSIGAAVGDFVEIVFDTQQSLKAAFAIYMLPIIAGLGAYLLADTLSLAYSGFWALATAAGTMGLGLHFGDRLEPEYTIRRRLDPKQVTISDHQHCASCPLR
ncbi:MAG: SoxR reducing system RseC family protein [Firmicutes bacterium]|nr:SoxR reducing system RseC family protein [Bacillota bacterium]